MKFNSVLLFPNSSGRVTEAQVASVEEKLDSLGIEHKRELADPFTPDAVIALGGDGTMLAAAHIAVERNIPLLGINFGTLGYMTGLESGEIELLDLLAEGAETEKRMLLEVTIEHAGEVAAAYTALNETAILRYPDSDMLRCELGCDGATVCAYRADGVIIATPTGSSAYAMSAGGPIIDTKLDAFCVCPVCPHALNTRAMIFSPNSELSIKNLSESGEFAVTADGRHVSRLFTGDTVKVKRSGRNLQLIKLKKDAFYDVLYRKLK